jgi:hypothetical protein
VRSTARGAHTLDFEDLTLAPPGSAPTSAGGHNDPGFSMRLNVQHRKANEGRTAHLEVCVARPDVWTDAR